MMNQKLDKLKNFRIYLRKQLDVLTTGQLNAIPTGYTNNIVWNLGHLISVGQIMCYVRSGLAIVVEEKYCSPTCLVSNRRRSLAYQRLETSRHYSLRRWVNCNRITIRAYSSIIRLP
jgi:hypothetical protein